MLIIRLTRIGKKNAPSFRVVLTEKTSAAKSGSFLEILGYYNPRQIKKDDSQKKKEIKLDVERINYWLSKGAQTSATVHNLLISEKVITGAKIKKKMKINKSKDGESKEEAPTENKKEPETEKLAEEVKPAEDEKTPAEKKEDAEQPKVDEESPQVDKSENEE